MESEEEWEDKDKMEVRKRDIEKRHVNIQCITAFSWNLDKYTHLHTNTYLEKTDPIRSNLWNIPHVNTREHQLYQHSCLNTVTWMKEFFLSSWKKCKGNEKKYRLFIWLSKGFTLVACLFYADSLCHSLYFDFPSHHFIPYHLFRLNEFEKKR